MSQNPIPEQLEKLVDEYAHVYWSADRTVSRSEDEACASELTRIMREIQLAFERLQRENIALEAKLAAAEAELDIAKDVIKQERLTRDKLKRRAANMKAARGDKGE